MSYILVSALARAGGIDLLLSTESFPRPDRHAMKRQAAQPRQARLAGLRRHTRFAGLRRRAGQSLIGLGQALSSWGHRWAPQPTTAAANSNLSFAAD